VTSIPHAQAAKPLARYRPLLSQNLNSIVSSGRGGSIDVEREQIQGSNSTLETVDTSNCSNNTTAFQYHSQDLTLKEDENNEDVLKSTKRKLKVLFLSADTGGGHRASAESLANQFLKHHPGTEYILWTYGRQPKSIRTRHSLHLTNTFRHTQQYGKHSTTYPIHACIKSSPMCTRLSHAMRKSHSSWKVTIPTLSFLSIPP